MPLKLILPASASRRQNTALSTVGKGFSLVELLVVISITSILLAIAIPAFSNMQSASRLRGVADVLMADLRYAMTESTKRGSDISVSFQVDVGGVNWCYGMATAACDCKSPGDCMIDGTERVTQGPSTVLADPTSGTFIFKPKRSTVTAGNILFTSNNAKEIKIILSGYGRIRPCSTAGARYVSGYPEC